MLHPIAQSCTLLPSPPPRPPTRQDTSTWSIRMLCLKALTHLVSYFSRALSDSMTDIMHAAWLSFTTSLQLYQVRCGNKVGHECGAGASAGCAPP